MREYPEVLHGVDDDDNVTDVLTYPDGTLKSRNLSQRELLELIYLELKKLNISMAIITDAEIKESDL